MAQTNYTPISLYYSTTASAAPTSGNLVNGELAINITDGKLYYKSNAGTVTLLASAAGASGDVVGPSSATDNALARFDTTTGKLIQNSVGILSDAGILTGLTGLTSSGAITLSSLTSGRVTYAGTAGLLQDSANLLFDGTTLTANALTVTNAVTLSGGTANGVTYLNGSKVLTSGSALTFDGTKLGVAGNNAAHTTYLTLTNNSTAGYGPMLDFNLGYASGITAAELQAGATGTNGGYFTISAKPDGGSLRQVQFCGDAYTAWNVTGSEQMRITSTGLGIGTSSPANKLVVNSGASTTVAGFQSTGSSAFIGLANSGATTFIGNDSTSGSFVIQTPGSSFSTKLLVDSTGNVGIGTSSPSNLLNVSTNNTGKVEVLRLQSASGFASAGGTFIRAGSGGGNSVLFGFDYDSSSFQVQNGNTSAAIMSVQNGGNVYLNGTSGFNVLGFEPATTIGSSGVNYITGVNTTNIGFKISTTEIARFNTSGALVVGTTVTQNTVSIYASGNSSSGGVIGARNGSGPNTFNVIMDSNADCGYLGTSSPSGSALLRIDSNYGTQFSYQGSEKMRIDTGGNLDLARTSSLLGNTSSASFTVNQSAFKSIAYSGGSNSGGTINITPSNAFNSINDFCFMVLVSAHNTNNSNYDRVQLYLVTFRATAFSGSTIVLVSNCGGDTGTNGEITSMTVGVSSYSTNDLCLTLTTATRGSTGSIYGTVTIIGG